MNSIKTQLRQSNANIHRSILTEKQVYMGFAMVLVVVYHVVSRFCLDTNWLGTFLLRGYVGVDVFLFFSGLGLCFSCSRNTLSKFYRNRFTRVLPLYVFMAIIASILHHITEGGGGNLWDYFCNITALSFYRLGGWTVEWFLPSLMTFYIFFPLVFKKFSVKAIILLCLASELIVLSIPMEWDIECFIARVGIFLLGILFYRNRDDSLYMLKCVAVSLALFATYYIFTHTVNIPFPRFLFMSLFAPLTIYVFSIIIIQKWTGGLKRVLAWIGKYTLEIYVANCLSSELKVVLPLEFYQPWSDVLMTIVFAFPIFYINRWCRSQIGRVALLK